MNEFLNEIKFDEKGLVPAVAYDVISGQVVMMAYMNKESIEMTLESGYCTYFSRSRQSLWKKGETSGHLQKLRAMKLDCDGDTILLEIEQEGAACHTGNKTCFYREYKDGQWVEAKENTSIARAMALEYGVVKRRAENPVEGSYTNYLFDKGIDKMLKKLGEEATEIIIAAKNPNPNEIVYEISDYLYHLMVVMAQKGITWDDVTEELARRQKKEENDS
jgi:phosphoribosyl-ATP pyrophosphohydrolase/phosphoribosyl-AMP cyclohydrolase